MAEDLDNLIRGAMKTLDGEVPSGYFEALPQRTLARLEDDPSMQTTTSEREPSTGVPPKPADDDSGLHDIRSLADTQKRRLARTSSAPAVEEDVLASTSASWRSIALPEPAKMISLPELAELPAKKIVIAKEKAAKAARASEPVAASAVAAPAPHPATARRTRTIALAGIGLAAAAGAVIFVAVQNNGGSRDVAQAVAVNRPAPAGAVAPAVQTAPPAVAAAPTPAPVEPAPAPPIETAAVPPEPAPQVAPTAGKHAPGKIVSKTGSANGNATKFDIKPTAEKPAAPVGKGGKGKDGNGDPSFDDLLKEAGVNEAKKPAAPKLERKSLSGADIKQGMGSVAARAQACYAGTQGTASVKLTVSPSGHVDKVTVGGAFAGTAVGNCVAAAVQGASFPAWDGAPQSINYSYLLSE